MKRLLVLMVLLVVGAQLVIAQDKPEETVREVLQVLNYGDPVFEADSWRVAAAEEASTYTSMLWRYKLDEEFLFFFLYLHFDGGATEEAVTTYFSGDNLKALLANYEPWRQTATCTIGDITIYEFLSRTNQVRRTLRYWVQTITPTRVLAVNGVVPEDQVELLDEYGERLFPGAASCAQAK